jgi:hypothetical protein
MNTIKVLFPEGKDKTYTTAGFDRAGGLVIKGLTKQKDW